VEAVEVLKTSLNRVPAEAVGAETLVVLHLVMELTALEVGAVARATLRALLLVMGELEL
jgi:hypothetical protein